MQVKFAGVSPLVSATRQPAGSGTQPLSMEPDRFSPMFGMTMHVATDAAWGDVTAALDRWIDDMEERPAAVHIRNMLREHGVYPASVAPGETQILQAVGDVARYSREQIWDEGREDYQVWRNAFRDGLLILRPYVDEAIQANDPDPFAHARLAIQYEGSVAEPLRKLEPYLRGRETDTGWVERRVETGSPLQVLGLFQRMSDSVMPDTITAAREAIGRHQAIFERTAIRVLQQNLPSDRLLTVQERGRAETALWFLGEYGAAATAPAAVFGFWERLQSVPLHTPNVRIILQGYTIRAMRRLLDRDEDGAMGVREQLAEHRESIEAFLDGIDQGADPDQRGQLWFFCRIPQTTNQIRRELLGDSP